MKNEKTVGLDSTPIGVWKCIGNIGLIWLAKLFNKTLGSQSIPNAWRKSTIYQSIRIRMTFKIV